jgi:hypothetical protein
MTSPIVYILIVLGVFLMFVPIIYVLRKKLNKVKSQKTSIPPDVMEDFMMAERLLAESNGTKTAQEVLFEVYKSRSERRLNDGTTYTNEESSPTAIHSTTTTRTTNSTTSSNETNPKISRTPTRPKGLPDSRTTGTEQTINSTELYGEPVRRTDIQTLPDSGIDEDKRIIGRNKKPNGKGIFSRFRKPRNTK